MRFMMNNAMNTPMVHASDVHKRFGSLEVLKGVSLDIGKGEVIAVIGPSGSGKSTLMHILGALDKPTLGEYILDGKNVEKTFR